MSESYYCEHCGQKYSSVSSLTSGSCSRHPNGPNRGKHSPYQGEEKDHYTCENCGQKYTSLSSLTSSSCSRHPDGTNKGKHSPML